MSEPAIETTSALPPIDWREKFVAVCLAQDIAARFDFDIEAVWETMSFIPNNSLVLLSSPQGWTAIADHVAAELTQQPRKIALNPPIH